MKKSHYTSKTVLFSKLIIFQTYFPSDGSSGVVKVGLDGAVVDAEHLPEVPVPELAVLQHYCLAG